jgi:hypothetical protein
VHEGNDGEGNGEGNGEKIIKKEVVFLGQPLIF